MNYQQNIRRSSLRFALRKTSIELVSGWFECARNKHDIPGLENADFDELEVENDFVEYLSCAIESFLSDVTKEQKSIPGWSFGYICGHTQGELNVQWTCRYLIEPSMEFEDLMKLKTILELIKEDSSMLSKIEIIYDYFLTNKNEVASKKEVLADNVISLVQRGKLKNTNRERYRKEFEEYFKQEFSAWYWWPVRRWMKKRFAVTWDTAILVSVKLEKTMARKTVEEIVEGNLTQYLANKNKNQI